MSCQRSSLRIVDHPILGRVHEKKEISIQVDGKNIPAYEGEPIAAALAAVGKKTFRFTSKRHEPRGIFCAIGRRTDCVMTVDGQPNIRTCVTPARQGMKVKTQKGLGEWPEKI